MERVIHSSCSVRDVVRMVLAEYKISPLDETSHCLDLILNTAGCILLKGLVASF